MEKKTYTAALNKYYKAVCDAYKLGNVESSYNAPIISLFTDIGCAARDLSGERKGDSGENIDIKLWHNEEEVTETEPFAGIEVKKVNGIDKRALQQIVIEANRYGNAILTDNLEWRFWRAGDTRMYTGIKLIDLENGNLILKKENVDLFFSLIEDFMLRDPAQINSSRKLAEYMAMHARTIRSIVSGILREDADGQPIVNDNQKRLPMFPELFGLYNRIKVDLRPSMDTREFADMYAQTIVYGLFIARYNDISLDTFDKYEAIGNLQDESELLKQFFMHIAGTGKKHPTLEGVIDKLCALYRICNIPELLEKDEHRDTIVHFYEEFLTYYDPELRKSLGVFYTPVQAVQYLVKMVDEMLISEFGIHGGLSNNEQLTIKVPCAPRKISKKKWSEELEVSVPRVAILDPACGTGSFGAEIIKYVKAKYFSGSKEAFYEKYIQEENGLLSRLIAFEIMMTSYVVAHLKMRRTIDATLGHAPDIQIPTNIFLTNTLAPPSSVLERGEQITLFDFSAAITDEAYHADTWKTRRPIRVVIGNPPYLAASTNPYDISAYKKETDGITDFGEQKHWLNDDYVKFFRFAEQIINKSKEGVLAYVTNNGYLDNHTFRGMRGSLLRSFDKIYIVNLHGRASKKDLPPEGQKNENIFDITQGIALFIGIKTTSSPIGKNIGIVFCKPSGLYSTPFVTKHIADNRLFSASCERAYIAPLYLYSDNELTGENWDANFDVNALNKLIKYLPQVPSPIEVFDYIYGVLHDPVYYEQYHEFLSRDFPRVPIINEPEEERADGAFYVSEELFKEYVVAGERLRKLHLMDIKVPAELELDPDSPDNMEISSVKYKNGILQINANTQIVGIPEDVWEYHIGGYKVLDKWLKEHKGEELSIELFTHIEDVVGILAETIKIKENLRALHP